MRVIPIAAGSAALALALSAGCRAAHPPAERRPAARDAKSEPAIELTAPADAEKTASGLASKVLAEGRGEQHPQLHDKVRVNFSVWNSKGKLTDGSDQRGGPVVFDMTGVIAGWTEALQQMREGERRRLWVPDPLAYPGRPGYPRGPSVFEVELLEIIEGVPPQPAPPDLAAAPSDAIKTASGLAYKVLERGAAGADKPKPWDRVTIHYTGWTRDGAMFDSSRSRQRPSVFDLDGVISGWREALPRLSVGDKARLWIPEALAYRGRAGDPRGDLVYDVELVSFERLPEPPRAPADVAGPPPNARKTQSGLAYRFLRRGAGVTKPAATDHVEVSYSAWTTDGRLFDSSVVRGAPATLPLNRLIPGWAEGLQLMAEGDQARLWIPEQLAYGGRDGAPKGMLVYDVALLRVVR